VIPREGVEREENKLIHALYGCVIPREGVERSSLSILRASSLVMTAGDPERGS
jgi:hypothetical protein